MKCLCCEQIFTDQSLLKDHYLTSHNVDENNHFFKKLFTRDAAFSLRKCFRCSYICTNRGDEKDHNFIPHYRLGGKQPAEDKPLQKTFFHQNLQRYCINFAKHNTHYNFCDCQELVSDFLIVFENMFVPRADLTQVRFKCTFKLWINNHHLRWDLSSLPTVDFGRLMFMMVFNLMILSRQISLKIFWKELL